VLLAVEVVEIDRPSAKALAVKRRDVKRKEKKREEKKRRRRKEGKKRRKRERKRTLASYANQDETKKRVMFDLSFPFSST